MNKHKWPAQCLACLMVLVLTATSGLAEAVGTVITKDGGSFSGNIRWLKASRVYVVTTKQNNKEISMRIKIQQVSEVSVKRPPDLTKALQQVQNKQYRTAIPVLERIRKEYERLEHDITAAGGLAECYLKTNKAEDTVKMCEAVFDSSPGAATSGRLVAVYWDALIKTGKIPKLENALDRAIEYGEPEVAAVAHVKRGDIYKQKGKLKEALIDGYLRTIVLFGRFKDVQPEAIYKAIECFTEIGDHSRAEKWRKKLLEQFPDDPYTKRIRSKM